MRAGSRTSFLVGIPWDGVQEPWRSATTLTPIIVCLVSCCILRLADVQGRAYSVADAGFLQLERNRCFVRCTHQEPTRRSAYQPPISAHMF